MAISLRGSGAAYINNAESGTIAFPAGAAAGDYCVLFAEHGALVDQPFGWRIIDSSTNAALAGAAFEKVLTAADIAAGSVSVGFGSDVGGAASYGLLAIAAFVGPCAGHRTATSSINSASSLSRAVTTDATPQAGDYALFFGADRDPTTIPTTGSVSSSAGSSLQSSSNFSSCGILAGQALVAGGAVADTFTFSAASSADYEIIVIVAPAAIAPLDLRAPLVVLESLLPGISDLRAPLITLDPLAEGSADIRSSLVTVESLDEGFRNLRLALFVLESLEPVLPGGHVSTELFPGSFGSPQALPGLAFSVHKRPGFSTAGYKGASGFGVRRANMQYPIWEFELTYEFLRADVTQEYQTLLGFFLSRLGAFDTFLFKDLDDYQVTGGQLAIADGVTTQFGFMRTIGGFAELVGQVDNGHAINIYVNGVLKTVGTDYTIALPNQVVFTTAPAASAVITADFQFFFNCKFQDDQADFDKFAQGFWELQKIVLETVPQ